MRFLFRTAKKGRPVPAPQRSRLRLEELEPRVVPSYTLTGNAWPTPQLITISFVPDGTLMSSGSNGNTYSNMFAKFNSRWSTSTWENAILSAAQAWGQYANINFAVVSDNGTAEGQGAYQQGDPGMGDIRIGMQPMAAGYLGMASYPPPGNNFSVAGDIEFNSNVSYGIGSGYDLQTVAMHEIGHALGLDHSTSPGQVMTATYGGLKRTLSADDIAGVQAIYGARQPDAYGGTNTSFASAATITMQNGTVQTSSGGGGLLGGVLGLVGGLLGGGSSQPTGTPGPQVQLNNLDLTTAGSSEYFTLAVPVGSNGSVTVDVQSSGLSLLRPSLTVYDSSQWNVLGSATSRSSTGDNLSVTINGVNDGQVLYIKVGGADSSAFSTGNFALTVVPGGGTATTVAPPNTQLLDGAIPNAQGGSALTSPLTAIFTLLNQLAGFLGPQGNVVQTDWYSADAQAEAQTAQLDATVQQAAAAYRAAHGDGGSASNLLVSTAAPAGTAGLTPASFQTNLAQPTDAAGLAAPVLANVAEASGAPAGLGLNVQFNTYVSSEAHGVPAAPVGQIAAGGVAPGGAGTGATTPSGVAAGQLQESQPFASTGPRLTPSGENGAFARNDAFDSAGTFEDALDTLFEQMGGQEDSLASWLQPSGLLAAGPALSGVGTAAVFDGAGTSSGD